MKANLAGCIATILAFAAIGISITVGLGVYPFQLDMLWSGLILGAIVAVPSTLISLAYGGVRRIGWYALTAALLSGGLYFVMSLVEFNQGHLLPSLVTAAYGAVSALVGATVARVLSSGK